MMSKNINETTVVYVFYIKCLEILTSMISMKNIWMYIM